MSVCLSAASCGLGSCIVALIAYGVRIWPLQDILVYQGLCARINNILCKHTFGCPPPLAHTIAHFIVSPRPHFIAIYNIQNCE